MYAQPAPKAKSSKMGVVIALLVTALVVAIAVIAYMTTLGRKPVDQPTESPPTPVPTVITGNQTAVRDLTVGTCFDEKSTKESVYAYAWPVDCTAAHDSEVFFVGTLPEGDYPSDDTVQTYVVDKCTPAFEKYVGIAYGDSKLQVYYIFADKDGWGAGNHSLVCYAFDPSGRTTSVKGVAK